MLDECSHSGANLRQNSAFTLSRNDCQQVNIKIKEIKVKVKVRI